MASLSDKDTFFRQINNFEYVPYTQTEGWYRYLSYKHPEKIVFIFDNPEDPTIGCFGYVQKFFHLRLLIIEGECIKDGSITREKTRVFFEEITSLGFDFIEVNSITEFDPEYEIGMRHAGYQPPVGVFSTHLSKVIDVQREIEYNTIWKKSVKRATRENFTFQVLENITTQDVDTFIELYNKLQVEKKFNHFLPPAQLQQLFADPNFKLAFLKNGEQKVVAAFIFYTDGKLGVTLFTAKAEEAKTTGAMFLLYLKVIEYLKNSGHAGFDVGRLTPSIKGLFSFKDGLKGRYVSYNNEWSWYKKSSYRTLMYFVKRFLMKKSEV